MGAGVRWLVEIDDTILEIVFKGTIEWRGAGRDGSVVAGENIHFMIIFE
jgi:hypothetical protein